MSVPIFIEPVVNREQGDCAISCLMMWTGKGYREVCDAAPLKAHRNGMAIREIIAAAEKLGARFRTRRKYDPHADSGILMLNPEPRRHRGQRWLRPFHAVVLIDGKVLDPYNARLWLDVDVYLSAEQYKPGILLAEDE